MGYRSTVFIGTTKEAYDKLKVKMKKMYPTDKEPKKVEYITTLIDDIKDYDFDAIHHVGITMESVKWYDGYDDVDMIKRILLKDIKDYEDTYTCEIVIGESYGDVEVFGDNDMFEVYPKTTLEYN